MKSLNIYFTGKDIIELREESVRNPQDGEVVVQAHQTLISSGTESIVLSRIFESGTHWENWVKYPFAPGYSFAGAVVAVGDGVAGYQVGDRVATRAPHHQFVTTTTDRMVHIPDNVADEDATWFGLASIVQNGVRRAEHTLGETVVVIGLGLLGQLVVQYLRLLGAREIIAIDMAEQRLAMARDHGATILLAKTAAEARDDVMQITDGAGADVVYDVTGVAPVLAQALKLVKRFGRLLLLGDSGTPSEQRLTADVITKGLRIIGAHDTNPPQMSSDHAYWSHNAMADLFFAYLGRGDMRVSDLITHRYAPGDAAEAYRMLREQRSTAMGVLFDWSK